MPLQPQSLDIDEQILIETRVTNDGPSLVLAYLFWSFLGIFSAHRFYLGRPVSAIIQILTFFIVVGFIWLLADLFLIPGMARDKRDRLREQMIRARLAQKALAAPSATDPAHALPSSP